MSEKVYRKEKKFFINILEYEKIIRKLNNILKEDIHNGEDGYVIRTLYFDTINDKDFEDKVSRN